MTKSPTRERKRTAKGRSSDAPVPPQKGKAEPSSPLDLSKTDWKATLKRTRTELKQDRVPLAAAGLSYYWFLSIFPALIAAVGILGLVKASPLFTDGIADAIRSFLPGDAAEVLTEAITSADANSRAASAIVAVVGILLALWSATSGMVGLQTGLNVAYDIPEERRFVRARGVGLLMLLATAILGGLACALLVFGDPLGEAIRDVFPLGDMFLVVWNVVRWVVTVVSITVLFAIFYYLAPNRGSPRWTWVSPGGVVATVIWVLASMAFSFYVSSFGSYARTYGSLAGVVVLVLWLYLSGLAVLAGGELNAELERQAQRRRKSSRKAD